MLKPVSRPRTILMLRFIEATDSCSVQVMLLMSQYLQGTQRSIKTWSIHGLAMKAAFQLGLHSAQTPQHFDFLDRETRLRTWHGCVVLDRFVTYPFLSGLCTEPRFSRTLSMTFGRPPTIPHSYHYGTLPRHQIGTESPIAWSSEPNSTVFWNATM